MYLYNAKVVSVYDGDTVRMDVDLGFGTWIKSMQIRLMGINTPELRTPTRDAGLKARDALITKVLNKPVVVRTVKDKQEKFGRYLGTIFVVENGVEVNVNDWMVSEGLAVPFMVEAG